MTNLETAIEAARQEHKTALSAWDAEKERCDREGAHFSNIIQTRLCRASMDLEDLLEKAAA